MTDCSATSGQLDAWLDGELSPAASAEVERHLAGCDRCRADADAIRSIVADARDLPRSVLPDRELWSGIEARTIATAVPAAQLLRLRGGVFRSPWGQLAAALLLVLFGMTLATLWQRRAAPSGFAAEQARYTAASAELAHRLAADPGVLNPSTRAVVQRNLAIIDEAIHEAETALAADPGNTALEQMLVTRYEQRLSLPHRATDAGRRES